MKENMEYKIKNCPVCNEKYEKCLKICPNCGYKEPLSFSWFVFAFSFLLVIILMIANTDLIKNINNKQATVSGNETTKIKTEEIKLNDSSSENDIEIPIRDLSVLSNLSKEEIFEKRKEYVKDSLVFNIEDYSPNEEVYQIEDNLPWMSAYEIAINGVENNPDIGKGESRNSISVNNPELLVSFLVPDFSKKNKDKTKYSKADYFLPEKLVWNKQEKILKTYFNIGSFYKINPDYVGLAMFIDETNARDMGYKWIYCKDSKNIQFIDENNNMSQEPYEMKGYYHKGYACGIETGCNNYSPYQKELPFRVLDDFGYLKLYFWKEKPVNKYQMPDITYEMYL